MLRIFSVLLLVLTLALPTLAKDKDRYQRPGPIHLTHDGDKWAQKTLHKLTLEEKIGQVFMVWCRASFLNVENPEYLQWRDAKQKNTTRTFSMDAHAK